MSADRSSHPENKEEHTPMIVLLTTYLSYALLIGFGHLRDYVGKLLGRASRPERGYAVLLADFDSFYTRRLYTRIRDCWNRPIASVPGRTMNVVVRKSRDYNVTFEVTKESTKCLNLGSYNYLGFAQGQSGPCNRDVAKVIKEYSVSSASARVDYGTTDVHVALERTVARFVGKPAALVFGMGFATNSTTLPALVGMGGLIISDGLNHASIVQGCRASGAIVRVFNHNDPANLRGVLRDAIAHGQPRSHRPWTKILVAIEGIYSMEGEICRLPEIVEVCKAYKAFIYLDEAHSIGALGRTGRGVCEQTGVNPADVDILMGTFTKSFGSVGGYIAGSEELISYLRSSSFGCMYCTSMSPPCAQMALSAMRVIMGEDGTKDGENRIRQLKDNANYFRESLIKLGFQVYGDVDSPVIPLMLYHPCKMPAFSRACLEEGLAVVVVGYPATPLITSRARFCVSASHTREDLDDALAKISKIGDRMLLKYQHVSTPYFAMRATVVPTLLALITSAAVYFTTFHNKA